jgi:hypothetical protein
MGKVMISKKFKLFLIASISVISCLTASAMAQDLPEPSNKLPVLHYAGVIPVQWDKGEIWSDLDHLKKSLPGEFSEAVRGSKRFTVLNDDLVASLWKTQAGRKELEKDYELSAYANLDVSARGDMVVLTARLLSPNLETRLQESDVIGRKTLSELTRDQSSARLVDLVMRLINRLPVDSHVTSVSGSYVTLSGGSDQGIKNGNKFDVYAAKIDSLHPAIGSWLTFSTEKTGTVEIIEVKSQSSIGRISALTHENSIKPGNGILIEAISGRSRFARAEETSQLQSAKDNESAIAMPVPTQKVDTPSPKDPETRVEVAPVPAQQKSPEPYPVAAQNQEQPVPEAQAEAQANPQPKSETTGDQAPETDNFTARLIPKGSELRTWIGMKMWSISGSASAAAQLPPWIVNSAGGSVLRRFSDTIDWGYGLDLGYGPTSRGSFFAYNLHASGRWHMYQKDILPGVDDIYFGVMSTMTSASISKETTGGYDMTTVMLTIGVHGWARPEFIGDKIEWTGEIFYPLYFSGKYWVRGKYRNIQSGSSTSFKVGGYVGDRPAEGWQYGAGLDYESSSWELERSRTAKVGSLGLSVLARRNI